MKHKKLFAFMIILSTLMACCNMIISASDIWSGNTWYIIDGYDFYEYQINYYINFDDPLNEAYINDYDGDEIQKAIIISHDVDEIFMVYNTVTKETYDIEITLFDVYINQHIYNYIVENEGGQIPLIDKITQGGAKQVFEIATNTTTNIAIKVLNAFWNNGLTFLGWIVATAFGLITTINIIKMISNSI